MQQLVLFQMTSEAQSLTAREAPLAYRFSPSLAKIKRSGLPSFKSKTDA